MADVSTSDFILRAKLKHGDEYDYSESYYTNATTKIKVICRQHGPFYISPYNHYAGNGCPVCRYIKSASKMRKPLWKFIEEATEIHNGKYDYSKVEYTNNRTKVCIICPEHGEFWQTPDKHILRKQGCPICGGHYNKTTEMFIADARKTHGDKYDYSKVEYVGTHTPVTIICPEHGEFRQAPNDHIHGQGCPHCKQSKIEGEVRRLLTVNGIDFIQEYRYDETNGKNRLDFYIPSKGIAIECQGEQHFKPVDFANKGEEWAMELFEKNIKRDVYKRDLCEKKDIKLVYYIPKRNIVPGYKKDEKFQGLYNDGNVYNSIPVLKKHIL